MNIRTRWAMLTLLTAGAFLGGFETAEAQARNRDVRQRTDRQRGVSEEQRAQANALLQRFARRVADAVDLDEAGFRRLQRELLTSRQERQRINLRRRQVRQDLARLARSQDASQSEIEALLGEWYDLHLALARVGIDEQRRLAEFLTPLQRARVMYLQEELARRAAAARPTDRVPDRDIP